MIEIIYFMYYIYNKYKREAYKYGLPHGYDALRGTNDKSDAFRHAFSSAAMVQDYDYSTAKYAGDLNEWIGDNFKNQGPKERNMDLWNNAKGRYIGINAADRQEIADWVHQAIVDKELITDFSDTRTYYSDLSNFVVFQKHVPKEVGNDSQSSNTIYQVPDETPDSTPTPSAMYVGPFARPIAARLSRNVDYEFTFVRDDGTTITPDLEEGLEIVLYDPEGKGLCTCYSQSLTFREEIPGLVASFNFINGSYRLELELEPMKELTGLTKPEIKCRLLTRGSKTIETVYSRAYYPEKGIHLIAPGSHTITIPYWYSMIQIEHPTLYKTEKTITIRSSIPFRADLDISNAQPLGNFLLPRLGVVWVPKPDLSGWAGSMDIRDVCISGTLHSPWQASEDTPPPTDMPTSHLERRYIVYENVVVKIALSACPGGWNALAVDLGSDLGFSHHLPYVPPGSVGVDLEHPISDFGKNLAGKSFKVTGELLWSGSQFTYSTGENPIHTNQIATLVESPVMDFDLINFQPLPEQV